MSENSYESSDSSENCPKVPRTINYRNSINGYNMNYKIPLSKEYKPQNIRKSLMIVEKLNRRGSKFGKFRNFLTNEELNLANLTMNNKNCNYNEKLAFNLANTIVKRRFRNFWLKTDDNSEDSSERIRLEEEKIRMKEKERLEKLRKEKEEKERLEREKIERERERKEREEREKREREEKERREREKREREEKERREREKREREKREKEEREKREREKREKEDREKREREKREREEKEKREREKREREEKERKERERREREEKEKREKEKMEKLNQKEKIKTIEINVEERKRDHHNYKLIQKLTKEVEVNSDNKNIVKYKESPIKSNNLIKTINVDTGRIEHKNLNKTFNPNKRKSQIVTTKLVLTKNDINKIKSNNKIQIENNKITSINEKKDIPSLVNRNISENKISKINKNEIKNPKINKQIENTKIIIVNKREENKKNNELNKVMIQKNIVKKDIIINKNDNNKTEENIRARYKNKKK